MTAAAGVLGHALLELAERFRVFGGTDRTTVTPIRPKGEG